MDRSDREIRKLECLDELISLDQWDHKPPGFFDKLWSWEQIAATLLLRVKELKHGKTQTKNER